MRVRPRARERARSARDIARGRDAAARAARRPASTRSSRRPGTAARATPARRSSSSASRCSRASTRPSRSGCCRSCRCTSTSRGCRRRSWTSGSPARRGRRADRRDVPPRRDGARRHGARGELLALLAAHENVVPRRMARPVPLTDHTDCVLVVIDVQPGFGGDADVLDAHALADALARALDVPVVATEEEPERHGPTRPGFIEAGTPVFRKPTFGLAGTPEILHAVHRHGPQHAVLVGLRDRRVRLPVGGRPARRRPARARRRGRGRLAGRDARARPRAPARRRGRRSPTARRSATSGCAPSRRRSCCPRPAPFAL